MEDQFAEIRDHFLAALERDGLEAQLQYAAENCADTPDLRAKLEEMLHAHHQPGGFLASRSEASPTLDHLVAEGLGTQIGPYKLLQKIGQGGMGVVYMADQKEPIKRRVALKIIKPGMDTQQVIGRFEAERQALAVMDHPNIARVLDAGTTDSGRPYFVMELVNGIPVTQYCDEQHLTPRERLELFIPICQAVQHAHQKGIIHRDIKPSNVLVALYDAQPVPKIIDFGVAKATTQTLTERTVFTQLGQIVGTLDYMSPEQAQRNQLDVDTRSDIYSLGVVLYELLTGETPFDRQRLRSAAWDEMLRIIREEEPPRPSVRLSSSDSLPSIAANRHIEPKKLSTLVRGELDWIVMKALAKDRGRRYQTANDFARDVQHYLADDPIEARPPTLADRAARWARRHRPLVTSAVVILLLSVVGLAASTALVWREQRRTADALAQAREQEDLARKEAAEAEREAAQRKAVLEFVTKDLLGSLHPDKALGPKVTVKEVLGNAERTVDRAFPGQPLVEAAVRDTMAHLYWGLGLSDAALPHAQLALKLRTEHLGPEHDDTLQSTMLLTRVLSAEEKLDESRRLAEQVLATFRRLYGDEDRRTLEAMGNLAQAVNLKGDPREAEKLLRKVLELDRRVRGNEDVCTLIDIRYLADVVLRLGEFEEARQLLEEALAGFRRVRGDRHPLTLAVMHNLGESLTQLGRYGEADKLFDQALAGRRQVLGDQHPDTLETMQRRAILARQLGNLDEARQLLEEALEGQRRLHGPESLPVAGVLHSLGVLLESQGRLPEARKVQEEALSVKRRVLGEDHPGVATVMSDLAYVLRAQKDLDGAAKLFRQVLEMRRRLLGRDNLYTLDTMAQLADVLSRQKKHSEACAMLEEVLEESRRAYGEEHPFTLRLMYDLASELIASTDPLQRQPQRAIELAKKVVAGPAVGKESVWFTLGIAHFRADSWEEAISAIQKSLELGFPLKGNAYCFLAMAHWHLGHKEEARQWCDQAAQWKPKTSVEEERLQLRRAEVAELLGIAGKPITAKESPEMSGKP